MVIKEKDRIDLMEKYLKRNSTERRIRLISVEPDGDIYVVYLKDYDNNQTGYMYIHKIDFHNWYKNVLLKKTFGLF